MATELEKIGKKLLETFPRASRASILTRAVNTAPLIEVWCNTRSGQAPGLDGERVLGTVEKWKRTVLIEDAKTHKLLRGIQKHHFQSCLAVPILDNAKFLKGMIYLTSGEAGAFNTHGRFACERIALESASLLETLDERMADGQATGERSSSVFSPQVLAASLGLILVVGLFLALFTGARPKDDDGDKSLSSRTAPREAAKDFLQHLRVGEFHQAWEMLDPSVQQKWSRELFQDSLEAWSEAEGRQLVLLTRELNGIKIESDGQAVATLFPTSLEHDDGLQWTWELRERERSWRVTGISGGPVASP